MPSHTLALAASVLALTLPALGQNTYEITELAHGSESRANATASLMQFGTAIVNGQERATRWFNNPVAPVDFTPNGFTSSRGLGMDPFRMVGSAAGPTTNGKHHAIAWNNSPFSFTLLHPSGFDSSAAFDTDGSSEVVGDAYLLVNGQLRSRAYRFGLSMTVNLHPTEYTQSFARGVYSFRQVGWGEIIDPNNPANNRTDALLWDGQPGSVRKLSPDSTHSRALAIGPPAVVGERKVGSQIHAWIWYVNQNTSNSLHPNGHVESSANAMQITRAGGYARPEGAAGDHAALWTFTGPAPSFTDLHPAGYEWTRVTGLDDTGNIVGVGKEIGATSPTALLWRSLNSRPFQGFIKFQDRFGNTAPPIRYQLNDNAWRNVNYTSVVAGTGQFSFVIPVLGTHQIRVKPQGYLGVKGTFTAQFNAPPSVVIAWNGPEGRGIPAGDTNDDNRIDDEDLFDVIADLGTPGGPNGPSGGFTDFNGDGIVDDADLTAIILGFGLVGE